MVDVVSAGLTAFFVRRQSFRDIIKIKTLSLLTINFGGNALQITLIYLYLWCTTATYLYIHL